MIRPLLHFLSSERRVEVLEQLSQASSPNFDFFLMVVLSTSISTLGLIINSAAVVIGAMLVAPLMSPILGLSLASVAGEQRMFRRALGALSRGILLSVVLATGLSWLAQVLPFDVLSTLPSEVLARTRPTPFDLVIALAGGAAAAYALAQPNLSAALPGVAIATALVPPLCTVGIGISLRNPIITLGALLLFATNLVAISFAGILVFAALGFRPLRYDNNHVNLRNNVLISAVLVLLVTIPLVVLSLNFVRQARQEQALKNMRNQVTAAIQGQLSGFPNAQLVEAQISEEGGMLHLLVTIRTTHQLTYMEVVDLQSALAEKLNRTLELELVDVPMTHLNPKIPPTQTLTPTPGPSPSPTFTATVTPTRKPPTATATITPTPTNTSTPTRSPTPTPVTAYIANTLGVGVYLRESPGGTIIPGSLPEDTAVQLLYRRELVNGTEWIEVRDLFGRVGWIQIRNLIIKP